MIVGAPFMATALNHQVGPHFLLNFANLRAIYI